jgi:expansin (peptidoglycan-binding protein)
MLPSTLRFYPFKKDQGKSVTIIVTDQCEACGVTDLVFSSAAFAQLADLSVGRIDGMTWRWD